MIPLTFQDPAFIASQSDRPIATKPSIPLGPPNTVRGVNAAGDAEEWKAVEAGDGIEVVHEPERIEITFDGAGVVVPVVFEQPTPASTWTINHNRGRPVNLAPFNSAGQRFLVEEDQSDPDVAVLHLESARSGKVVYV